MPASTVGCAQQVGRNLARRTSVSSHRTPWSRASSPVRMSTLAITTTSTVSGSPSQLDARPGGRRRSRSTTSKLRCTTDGHSSRRSRAWPGSRGDAVSDAARGRRERRPCAAVHMSAPRDRSSRTLRRGSCCRGRRRIGAGRGVHAHDAVDGSATTDEAGSRRRGSMLEGPHVGDQLVRRSGRARPRRSVGRRQSEPSAVVDDESRSRARRSWSRSRTRSWAATPFSLCQLRGDAPPRCGRRRAPRRRPPRCRPRRHDGVRVRGPVHVGDVPAVRRQRPGSPRDRLSPGPGGRGTRRRPSSLTRPRARSTPRHRGTPRRHGPVPAQPPRVPDGRKHRRDRSEGRAVGAGQPPAHGRVQPVRHPARGVRRQAAPRRPASAAR